jgi:hypothetical protein
VRQNRKLSYQVPDTSLVGSGTVSTGITLLTAGEYCLQLLYQHLKNNGFETKKTGNLCLLYNILSNI